MSPARLAFLCAALFFVVAASAARGQSESATLIVSVSDGSGAPVPGATSYEYLIQEAGQGSASARGVTPGIFVQVPLAARNGQSTLFNGIVRACPVGQTCVGGSKGRCWRV